MRPLAKTLKEIDYVKIEILGTGCAKCKKLYELANEALKETGVQAEVVKVEKLDDIMNYGVMLTPALVIDGVVKMSGKLPSKAEIIKLLK